MGDAEALSRSMDADGCAVPTAWVAVDSVRGVVLAS